MWPKTNSAALHVSTQGHNHLWYSVHWQNAIPKLQHYIWSQLNKWNPDYEVFSLCVGKLYGFWSKARLGMVLSVKIHWYSWAEICLKAMHDSHFISVKSHNSFFVQTLTLGKDECAWRSRNEFPTELHTFQTEDDDGWLYALFWWNMHCILVTADKAIT